MGKKVPDTEKSTSDRNKNHQLTRSFGTISIHLTAEVDLSTRIRKSRLQH